LLPTFLLYSRRSLSARLDFHSGPFIVKLEQKQNRDRPLLTFILRLSFQMACKWILVFITMSCCLAIVIDSARPAECEQALAVGPCRGMFPRFYFNPTTNRCESFTYGGCQGMRQCRDVIPASSSSSSFHSLGNENRFETEEACSKHCDNKGN
jgi:hypothetical protein